MLTGRYEPIPADVSKITPSTWQSMSDSFKSDFLAPALLFPGVSSEDRKSLSDTVGSLQQAANSGDQGFGQKTGNWFAGVAGGAVNPLSLLGGEVGGMLAKPLLSAGAGLIGRYVPFSAAAVATGISQKTIGSMLGENIPRFVGDKTIGQMGEGAVSGYVGATGFSLPQEIADTYDQKNNSFNWWGGIKAASADGGVGLGMMSVPFLAGTIWGKMFKGVGEDVAGEVKPDMPMPQEALNNDSHPALNAVAQAVQDGKITPEQGQWFNDYLQGNVSNKDLADSAVQHLIKDGYPVDAATKRVLFSLLKPEDVDTMQSALADSMASTMPDDMKSKFPAYVTNAKIDDIRGNTKLLDGINGVVQFIKKRLAMQPEEMVNVNKIIRRFLPESLKDANPFSQSKLYRALKSGKELGVTVPKQVERRLSQEEKINQLNQSIKNYQKELDTSGKQKFTAKIKKAQARIDELQASLEPLLNHGDEMKYLREKLLPEGKLKENFKNTREYQRLMDLTRVRNSAQQLMQELHVRHEYDLHGHYANVLDAITKTMRASVGQLADHDQLINYMKERVIRQAPDLEHAAKVQLEESEKLAKESKPEAEPVMEDKMREAPSEIKSEYDAISNQFKEFSEKKGVLNNFINCLKGTMNV